MVKLEPFFDDVQSHYDLSDAFYGLFLDPSQTYSCAFFERDEMTLEEAQRAKVDLSLNKCDLRPGLKLLDVGCGWGTTALTAAQDFQVNVIGLTLSKNQWKTASQRVADLKEPAGKVEFRLEGWEEFNEPVDRIVSIGAFEHFRHERHAEFFRRCHDILPEKGRLLLHTIVLTPMKQLDEMGVAVTAENVTFAKFIRREIFPGGQLCVPEQIEQLAQQEGFELTHTQSLRLHYAKTLDIWAEQLKASQEEAVRLTSSKIYDRYMKYLTGCADHFRSGHIDVMQFTLLRA